MKIVILFALAVVASAAKLDQLGRQLNQGPLVTVLRDDRDGPIGAEYSYVLETDNGVRIDESGTAGSAGQSNKQGSYAFESPEGIVIEVRYNADEGGFQPVGDHLPKDHPAPAHVAGLLRIAEQQEAEGIRFDGKGFRIP